MAGFAFKELANVSIAGTGIAANTNFFTVPAGHTYVIKRAHLRITRNTAGADTYNVQRSDTAGANFRNIIDPITTLAAASIAWVDLTPLNPTLQTSGIVAEGAVNPASATSQYGTLNNVVCEAGTILRIVTPAGFAVGDTIEAAIDGVDNTL